MKPFGDIQFILSFLVAFLACHFIQADIDPRRITNGLPGLRLRDNHSLADFPLETFPDSSWDRVGPSIPPEWNAAVCKGRRFLSAIRSTEREAAEVLGIPEIQVRSPFQDFPALFRKWKYFVLQAARIRADFADLDPLWGIGTTLRALGVSDSCKPTGSMECVYISHGWPFDEHDRVVEADKQPYEVNGKQYLTTDAHFFFGVNKKDGVLIAFSRSGPAYTEVGKKIPQNIPDLKQASDMAWGSLMRYMSVADASKIRYFISVSIVNELTKRIISKSTNNEGAPTKWPGKSFTMDTEEGQALLGNPNAQAIAHLLIGHKAEMGTLRIKKVTVFLCDSPRELACLLFELGDAGKDGNRKRVLDQSCKGGDDEEGIY